jgi:hypothetical protein
MEDEDRRLLTELLRWFGENLATPDRFNRSKSKGFYRRTTRGIAAASGRRPFSDAKIPITS